MHTSTANPTALDTPHLCHVLNSPHLHELLRSDKLEALPSLEGLHSLKALQLKYNGFTQLPPQLATLPHLELLDLSGNQIRVLDDVLLLGLPKLRCMFGDAWCE